VAHALLDDLIPAFLQHPADGRRLSGELHHGVAFRMALTAPARRSGQRTKATPLCKGWHPGTFGCPAIHQTSHVPLNLRRPYLVEIGTSAV
jgi:hypothetical protein